MDKIRYRLVYNRKHQLNNQGAALVQIEAKLHQRNIYMTTGIYLRPEHWDKTTAQVINHPQATDLNAYLFEKIINLQSIELAYWKRGIQPTLAILRESIRKKIPANITFLQYCRRSISTSDKKTNTKNNLMSTVRILSSFRPGLDFPDLTYTFVKEFEGYLKDRGSSTNTVAKHLRQLRTMVNEAINDGYIPQDSYPFRKFKIKQEKPEHAFLTPHELRKLEKLELPDIRQQHILHAFLFCCYTGLRFSDFRQLTDTNIVLVNRTPWLFITMQKTELEIKLPLQLLFQGKAIEIISKYPSVKNLADIPANAETNRIVADIASIAHIKKRITFHTSRHTCATLLIYQGVPVTTVQKILGHTSLKTTQIYSEVLSDTVIKDLKIAQKRH